MFKSIYTAVFGVAIVLVLASLADATVINADLAGPTNNGVYSGQGAYADPGNSYWNGLTASGAGPCSFSALKDSTGAVTTSVSFAADYVGGNNCTGNPLALFGDDIYAYDGGAPYPAFSTFTIGGLTPNSGGYSLYLYGVIEPTYGSTFSFDNFVTSQSTTGASANGFQLGVNYVVFSNLTANSSGQIVGEWKTSTGNHYGPFNGFQLISSVPEPGTLALLACGLAGLLCYAWRKRR